MDFKKKTATVSMKTAKDSLARKAVDKALAPRYKVVRMGVAGAKTKHVLSVSGMV